MLEIGSVAPDFLLEDENGHSVKLSDYRGKKVVLYFYPRDNTPGCTKQALAYKEQFSEFVSKDVVVFGVSKDTVASHRKFKDKYELPFSLLSNPTLDMLQAYDVWVEKKLYGKVSMGILRSSYVINEEGIIVEAFAKVKPDEDACTVIGTL